MSQERNPRLAFALDYATLDEARAGAALVAPYVGVLKTGLELFVRHGRDVTRLGEEFGVAIFLDLKLHDIPKTVERAVENAAELGVEYLTLHAAGGRKMISLAADCIARRGSGPKLLAVTVLTSMDQEDLRSIGVEGAPTAQVERLAKLAVQSGADGLVCSVLEVRNLRRALGPKPLLVTPGIRLGGATTDDQKRVGTPAEAIAAGASLLVVGRPIRDAADPARAAAEISRDIREAAANEL